MVSHSRATGKWAEPGVPHKGWTCEAVEDLGSDGEELHTCCEMCEVTPIRYGHTMTHPDHESLVVGCVCAEHMSDDYVGPKRRENALKSRARRRVTWARRTWRTSQKGNDFLNTDGYNVVIFRASGGFRFRISWDRGYDDITGDMIVVERKSAAAYGTKGAAKIAAFDALENIRAGLRSETTT